MKWNGWNGKTPYISCILPVPQANQKGITHVHNDMISHSITTKWVLDLRDDDVYWCTADPGWVTGTVYGLWGPWLNGISSYIYDGRFDAAKWYEIIQTFKVTVWYTAPTALRMLMKDGDDLVKNMI